MVRVIGLTGSLGTGKTTVAAMFRNLGAKVFDADKIVHDLMKKGNPCYAPLIALLGESILAGERIDRKKVARVVFQEPDLLRRVEAIIHPEVVKFIGKEICEGKKKEGPSRIYIFDVPLLFESNLDSMMDFCVVVKATQQKQIERASARLGITKHQALLRIKAQMPLREKVLRADWVIDNNQDIQETKKQVKGLWQEILQIRK